MTEADRSRTTRNTATCTDCDSFPAGVGGAVDVYLHDMNFLICLLDVALVFTPIYECDVLLYARMYLLLAAYRARLLSTMAPLAFIPVIIGRKYRYFCHRSTFFFFFSVLFLGETRHQTQSTSTSTYILDYGTYVEAY